MPEVDIIAAIDAVTGCQQCGWSLEGSVSDDFCSQDCQEEWHAAHTTPLVGYREPDDLPQHIYNQVEDDDPEVTPHGGSLFPRWVTDEIGRLFDRTVMHTTPPPALRSRDVELEPGEVILDRRTVGRIGTGLNSIPIVTDPGAPRDLAERLRENTQRSGGVVFHTTTASGGPSGDLRAAFERLSTTPPRWLPDGVHEQSAWGDEIPADRLPVISFQFQLSPEQQEELLFNEAMKPMQAFAEALQQARAIERPLPTEPRARALELRRRRNTGPTQQQRAPRAINPRRAR